MVRHEFDAMIENLGAFYERKVKPISRTLEMWFEKVKKIPSEAVMPIQDKIMDECERWPANLTATMWAMYHRWLDAHPEKRAFREAVNCPDCEGGWLVLSKLVEGYKQPLSFSAPCGRCRQIPAANYMTIFQAREKGYERTDLKKQPWDGRTAAEMASTIGRPVPEVRVYAD